ncbi:Protein FAM227B [Manis javanica]|nr:Protein FAM227B [Manis javanica]
MGDSFVEALLSSGTKELYLLIFSSSQWAHAWPREMGTKEETILCCLLPQLRVPFCSSDFLLIFTRIWI